MWSGVLLSGTAEPGSFDRPQDYFFSAPGQAADTGQDIERISRDINRDYWMSAQEARDYGVIDIIHGQTEASQAADRAEAAVNEASHEATVGTADGGSGLKR